MAAVFLLLASACAADGFEVAAPGDWVDAVAAPAFDETSPRPSANGVVYLLVDRQWRRNEADRVRYAHFVTQALNPTGVESTSHISIDFDPAFESLTLHQITVHRDGQQLDRLDRSQISLIQREQGLENQIFDGAQTLNVFVDDVRAGDAIEYSYSISGSNPVLGDHFAAMLFLQWEVPVRRVRYRVLWESPKALQIRAQQTTVRPQVTAVGGAKEYVWSADSVDPLIPDPNLPDWYDPFPTLYLSDMRDWQEVADWAEPLYSLPPIGPNQQAVIDRILAGATTPAQRVSAALNFVQDEVRYLGIEMGPRSHRPREPDEVLERRFGDCKDKSRLLVSLLRGMGVDAVPALVNTRSNTRAGRGLPTPTAFNHVIVRATVDGRSYWLDPTESFQGTDIEHLAPPDYGDALLVADGAADLVGIPGNEDTTYRRTVVETFDIRDAVRQPASYVVETLSEQGSAESMRQQLAETDLDELQHDYLDYYAYYYPEIEVDSPMSVDDDRRGNRVRVGEYYRIPGVWAEDDPDQQYLSIDFLPFVIRDHLTDTSSRRRSMPLAVDHPVRYRQTTRIKVPPDSHFDDEHQEVADEAFRFVKDVTFSDGVLQLDYEYESLRDHVPANQVQAHARNIKAVYRLSHYQIELPKETDSAGSGDIDPTDLNWAAVGSAAVMLFVAPLYMSP